MKILFTSYGFSGWVCSGKVKRFFQIDGLPYTGNKKQDEDIRCFMNEFYSLNGVKKVHFVRDYFPGVIEKTEKEVKETLKLLGQKDE